MNAEKLKDAQNAQLTINLEDEVNAERIKNEQMVKRIYYW